MSAAARNQFGGIIAAAVAPRRSGETSIDLAATLELVDFLGEKGVSAIALLGSTGEFVHFALDDRMHMTTFAVRRSRVPLLVNVSHSTLDGAVELSRAAAEAGAGGVLLMPPYYFRYDQDSIRAFYLRFAELTGTDIPIYLYNIPAFTNELTAATAVDLLSSGKFAGIKDSSGSLQYLSALVETRWRNPVTVLVGSDALFAKARLNGVGGAVSGVACAVPELLLGLSRAIESGDAERTARLETYIGEFLAWIDPLPTPVAIKEACRLRKLKIGADAVPLGPAGKQRLRDFGEWFTAWLPKVEAECRGVSARR